MSTSSRHEYQSQNDTRKYRQGLCVVWVHTKTLLRLYVWRNSPSGSYAASLLEVSRDHTHTHTHARARARSLGGTSLDEGSACRRDNWQNTTLIRHIHAPGGIRTRNPNKRAPADPRRRPPGCWDRHQDTSRPKSQRIIEVTSLWPLCSICVGLM